MTIKALIFDDNDLVLNTLAMFLTSNAVDVSPHHYATCPMYEKKSVLCPVEIPAFNFIISDNNMPNMTGIEFYEDIETKGCKVPNKCKALLSGDVTQNLRNRAKKLGIEVFEKPCSFEVLGRWIDTAIQYSH